MFNRKEYLILKFTYRKLKIKVWIKITIYFDGEMQSRFQYRSSIFSQWKFANIGNGNGIVADYIDFNDDNIRAVSDLAIKLSIFGYRKQRAMKKTKLKILKLKKEMRG